MFYGLTQYVNIETLENYDRFNRPFMPVTRACPACTECITLSCQPVTDFGKQGQIWKSVHSIIEDIIGSSECVSSFAFALLSQFQSNLNRQLRGESLPISEIYTVLIKQLSKCIYFDFGLPNISPLQRLNIERLSSVSKMMISLELDSERWKVLQFKHLARFPKIECQKCGVTSCYSCSSSPFHLTMTCKESIIQALANEASPEMIATLKWQVENSKRCPRCSTVISRDEGCNQVNCLFCGFTFCWYSFNLMQAMSRRI